jgi:hypothetical protein
MPFAIDAQESSCVLHRVVFLHTVRKRDREAPKEGIGNRDRGMTRDSRGRCVGLPKRRKEAKSSRYFPTPRLQRRSFASEPQDE